MRMLLGLFFVLSRSLQTQPPKMIWHLKTMVIIFMIFLKKMFVGLYSKIYDSCFDVHVVISILLLWRGCKKSNGFFSFLESKEHTKRNAELVLMYSTVCPFRLRGKTLICVYCCDEFEDPDQYRSHMDETHDKVNLATAFAHTSNFRCRDYLKVDCLNLTCKLCHEPFYSVAEIAQHLANRHSKNKDIQDMDLNHEVGLHPYRLAKDKLCCLVCNMKLPTLIKLARHMSSHYADFFCDICGRSYLNMENLKYHIKFSHSDKYLCRKCKKEFPTKEERKNHMKSSMKCRPFPCIYCVERFFSWELKQKHLVSQHNGQVATYPCPECAIVFESRKRFYAHYTTTHSDLALKCSWCGKKFQNKSQLEDHRVVHTGEKQHQCTVCFKTFTRDKSLRQHMWMHSETKRFTCDICNRSFNQKVCFKSHMKNVHPAVSMQF